MLIGIVLDLIVKFAVRIGCDRKETIRLVDKFVRENDLDRVNDFIIRDEEWLGVRIDGDITEAIEEYQLTEDPTPVTITEYIYSEKESDGSPAQELLGGEMRLTAPNSTKTTMNCKTCPKCNALDVIQMKTASGNSTGLLVLLVRKKTLLGLVCNDLGDERCINPKNGDVTGDTWQKRDEFIPETTERVERVTGKVTS